jgi:hypothetical protein
MKRKILSFEEWQNYLETYRNTTSEEFKDLLASWESERSKNKEEEELQIYGLYESDGPYEDVYYLITGFDDKYNSVLGFMFDKETLELICMFNLVQPVNFKKIDNVFMGTKRFKLKLIKRNMKWEGWN